MLAASPGIFQLILGHAGWGLICSSQELSELWKALGYPALRSREKPAATADTARTASTGATPPHSLKEIEDSRLPGVRQEPANVCVAVGGAASAPPFTGAALV